MIYRLTHLGKPNWKLKPELGLGAPQRRDDPRVGVTKKVKIGNHAPLILRYVNVLVREPGLDKYKTSLCKSPFELARWLCGSAMRVEEAPCKSSAFVLIQ